MTKQAWGFTLIELLIVVAIIGILAAIAVPNFLQAQTRAKISRVYADQSAIETVLAAYYVDWGTYVEDHDYPTERHEIGFFRLTHPVPYIAALPVDPFQSALRQNWEVNPSFEFGAGHATDPSRMWPNQAYVIISPGPDVTEQMQGNDEFPCPGRICTIFTFDLSNGLRSTGDIVRLGGLWTPGNIIQDGRWIAGGPQRR